MTREKLFCVLQFNSFDGFPFDVIIHNSENKSFQNVNSKESNNISCHNRRPTMDPCSISSMLYLFPQSSEENIKKEENIFEISCRKNKFRFNRNSTENQEERKVDLDVTFLRLKKNCVLSNFHFLHFFLT